MNGETRRMNSRERLLKSLDHQEPDRVPLDLGATQVTGIHAVAYQRLRSAFGLPPVEIKLCDYIQGLALPDQDVLEQLGVDVRGLYPLNSQNWKVEEQGIGDYWIYKDEWGIIHRRPFPNGLYYSQKCKKYKGFCNYIMLSRRYFPTDFTYFPHF